VSKEYTNSRELPEPMANAIKNHNFFPINDGISVSRLSDAPQIPMLKREHKIQEDVADMTWALIHRGMLNTLEQGSEAQNVYRSAQVISRSMRLKSTEMLSKNAEHPKVNTLKKVREVIVKFAKEFFSLDQQPWVINQTMSVDVSFEMDRIEGDQIVSTEKITLTKTVFDTIALYDRTEQVLYLPKICSVATAYKPHLRTQWEREAQVQSYILHHNGMPVKAIRAVMIFKDWSAAEKNKRATYPSAPSQTIPLNLDTMDKIDVFVKGRLRKHAMVESNVMPECTEEDRWSTAESYAVVRPNSERYLIAKDFATAEGAQEWINDRGPTANGCIVDVIPGESRRCKEYCPVRHVCPQWAREQEKLHSLESKNKK
jgi:hypothetical protein